MINTVLGRSIAKKIHKNVSSEKITAMQKLNQTTINIAQELQIAKLILKNAKIISAKISVS